MRPARVRSACAGQRAVQQEVGWDQAPLHGVDGQAQLLEHGEAEQRRVA